MIACRNGHRMEIFVFEGFSNVLYAFRLIAIILFDFVSVSGVELAVDIDPDGQSVSDPDPARV